MAGIVHGEQARQMSCFYDKNGAFVCQVRRGGPATAEERVQGQSQALASQLQDRERAKLRLADALAAGGMGADLDGDMPAQELGYEESPRPGAFIEGERRLAPDQGMQLSNLTPDPRPIVREPLTASTGAAVRTGRPSVPRVASLTYSAP